MSAEAEHLAPSSKGRWRTSVVATAALGVVGLLLALGLAEGALRILTPAITGWSLQPALYRPDARTGFRYLPNSSGLLDRYHEIHNHVKINSLGFHDREPDLTPGRRAVLVLGNSFTANLQVPHEASWTRLAGDRLGLEVINAGLDGTGTDAHLEIARELIPRTHPTRLVLAFYANDSSDVRRELVYRDTYRGFVIAYQDEMQGERLKRRVDAELDRHIASCLYRRSHLMRLLIAAAEGSNNLLRTHFAKPSDLGEVVRERRNPPPLSLLLRQLRDEGDRAGAPLVVIPMPHRSDLRLSLRTLLESGSGSGLDVVDIAPAIEAHLARDGRSEEALFWVNDVHLNVYGNEVVGKAVAEALAERIRPSTRRDTTYARGATPKDSHAVHRPRDAQVRHHARLRDPTPIRHRHGRGRGRRGRV